ncbi:probable leucine-rich repeat receptor-like protein kinase At5g49770 isoform X2 [Phoenix dactylifera]|uniref:non-specific serine/threonine protein kinase n=1 Tax=Phoenix dactylifera TaxID=42345 RepID=A0A8B9A1B4_PHODC|nr:probable leucine-rich repeat receptor-like protein kinase At5g49770 isoform X2 [Phoenix dactylifera]
MLRFRVGFTWGIISLFIFSNQFQFRLPSPFLVITQPSIFRWLQKNPRLLGRSPLLQFLIFLVKIMSVGMGRMKGILLLLVCAASLRPAFASTNPSDVAALRSLANQWKNTPPNWGQSDDPCGTPWEGVTCNNSRVTVLKLFSMGLEGTLSSDIQNLTQLQILDLSYNRKLGGTLPRAIGNLTQLTSLILVHCSFNGSIPEELGNLSELTFLALNLNEFTGEIPASLGRLSKLNYLDLAENHLVGSLPVGLNQLLNAQHFHFNGNNLSGEIPKNLFNSNMSLIHILFNSNQLKGTIPESIGLVHTLNALRLDKNGLSGQVPSNITNLKNLNLLNLANNDLSGQMPNLTGMDALNYVDLSNNSFVPSEAPAWFSSLENLTTLVVESGRLQGRVPQELFSFPRLQEVTLKNNSFNGTLDLGNNISKNLQVVDFQNNDLASVTLSYNYNQSLILVGNPVCRNVELAVTTYCRPVQLQEKGKNVSNQVDCSQPYEGNMVFRAPYFHDMEGYKKLLENSLSDRLNSISAAVNFTLQNSFDNGNGYLLVQLKVCPLSGTYFNRTEILLWLDLSSESYSTPEIYGPFYFNADPYQFETRGNPLNSGLIIGATVGCVLMILGLVMVGIYALRQRKQAQRAIALTNPFASWVSTGEDDGGAPQLKGAKCFSFDELRKYTNNFLEINAIGSGGYGKVYRGMLPDGQIVAIKRSKQGSTQGGMEFKNEIELLSRVHHKNLVGLVGFCFEKGEKMLVYEYISNGSLMESLSGKSGIQLDWKRRLRIAFDSARGLAYLHELANPPIIHRDVKSANILLDENLTAKVADFGLSKWVSDSEQGLSGSRVLHDTPADWKE